MLIDCSVGGDDAVEQRVVVVVAAVGVDLCEAFVGRMLLAFVAKKYGDGIDSIHLSQLGPGIDFLDLIVAAVVVV